MEWFGKRYFPIKRLKQIDFDEIFINTNTIFLKLHKL